MRCSRGMPAWPKSRAEASASGAQSRIRQASPRILEGQSIPASLFAAPIHEIQGGIGVRLHLTSRFPLGCRCLPHQSPIKRSLPATTVRSMARIEAEETGGRNWIPAISGEQARHLLRGRGRDGPELDELVCAPPASGSWTRRNGGSCWPSLPLNLAGRRSGRRHSPAAGK